MKLRNIIPLGLLMLTIACGPSESNQIDVATQKLISGIDNASTSEVRSAILNGARADASAGFGKTALHYASEIGDADLTKDILNHLALQKASNADLVASLTQTNKEAQSAIEVAARRAQVQVVDAFAAFCDSRNILRITFFPLAKKLAAEKTDSLEIITSAISRFGVAKYHMAHLIYETIGTKEGQAIISAHDSDLFLFDFALAYLFAIDASPDIQNSFFKVASGFRIEKRMELIDLMSSQNAKNLYRDLSTQIRELSARFGIEKIDSTPIPLPSPSRPADTPKSSEERRATAVDQNARLRDAVSRNDIDALQNALENGGRIDALDSQLRNVFHIAALKGRAEAMTILLSQLQCSNADIVLLQKDENAATPLFIAANQPSEKLETLRAISRFVLASKTCNEIGISEIREWTKAGYDDAIRNAFTVFSQINHGVEVIADIMFRLIGGEYAAPSIQRVENALCQEAKDHMWSRVYYKALVDGEDLRTAAVRSIVKGYPDAEQRQIVGFMLFLNSGNSNKIHHDKILSEVDVLQLPRAMFEGSSDGVGEIKQALDEIVTGQENAKISLAVAIKNHYERVKKGLKKSNILILGPSGSGKTLLVQTIAKKLDVPFALFDATNITQAGYVGGKASDAIGLLAEKGEFDKEKIERGIVFLDEIDKMASRSGRSEQDEFKRQGQASLLKMLEGIEVEIEVNRFTTLNIDTSNILFVCAGAFTGLPEIISERLKADGLSLGDAPFEQATAEDLIKYGMAPEFLGRLPNVITLKHLTVADMVNILKNPKASVLEEYRAIFDARGVEIKFSDGAIFAMAERAVTYNVGARALRTVAESVMSDLQFRVGQLGMLKSITVTERVVRYGDMPTLEYKVQ